ncbi:hypothetical protein H1R20_g10834, partial [Candolleomyces eurysporus]
MRTNFISAGFVFLSIALQASAAPLVNFDEPSTQNFRRGLELDLSEVDNRHFDLDDLETRAGLWDSIKKGASKFFGSPIVQTVGTTAISAAATWGANRAMDSFANRRQGRRSLELDLSDIDNRDFDIDELEKRVAQSKWDRFKQGASAFFNHPVTQTATGILTSALMGKVLSGGSRKRSLELDVPELSERELDLFDEVPVLGARTSDGLPELDARQMSRGGRRRGQIRRRIRMSSGMSPQGAQEGFGGGGTPAHGLRTSELHGLVRRKRYIDIPT